MKTRDEHVKLVARLDDFLHEADVRSTELAALSDREAADTLSAWPSAARVREAARAAAAASDYLEPARATKTDSSASSQEATSYGRRFDATAIYRLGIAGLFRTGRDVDHDLLTVQLAGYLAGPPIPLEHFVVLDGDLGLEAAVTVCGWKLYQPTSDELDALRAVPAAAEYAPDQAWDPLLRFGSNWALQRVEPTMKAQTGTRILPESMFRYIEPEMSAWEPLLLLNLYSIEPIHLVAEYLVEPQRRIDGNGSIPSTVAMSRNGELVDIPELGPFYLTDHDSHRLQRFLIELSNRLACWPSPDRTLSKRKLAADPSVRLKWSATHFLRANQRVMDHDGPIFVNERAQIVFDYVVTLERMLLGVGEENVDITRRLSQRTAILSGRTDEERLEIERVTRDAYTLRSSIAHGSPRSENIDDAHIVQTLRTVLRRVLLARIALGPAFSVREVCDRALLSSNVLNLEILDPVLPVWDIATW